VPTELHGLCTASLREMQQSTGLQEAPDAAIALYAYCRE
jgi:hypothetical protein